eukprot:1307902-Rhodomonas_salina.7
MPQYLEAMLPFLEATLPCSAGGSGAEKSLAPQVRRRQLLCGQHPHPTPLSPSLFRRGTDSAPALHFLSLPFSPLHGTQYSGEAGRLVAGCIRSMHPTLALMRARVLTTLTLAHWTRKLIGI